MYSFHINNISNFSLIFSLCLFALFSSSTELEESNFGVQRADGYDCGNQFFTDKMVFDALEMASSDKWKKDVKPYIGPLFGITMGYLTWPIALDENSNGIKKFTSSRAWRGAKYQVVFINDKVIDVIVRLKNREFAKCWRVDSSKLEAQSKKMQNVNGYYCGSRFIPREHLEESAQTARKYIGKDQKYPAPYVGHLYSKELGFLIWPIYKGIELFKRPNYPASPYLIVISPMGQIKDVIAQTLDYGFVKCILSDDPLPAHGSNIQSMKKQSPRSGFDCSGIFFDDNDLQLASDMAWKSRSTNKQSIFPKTYSGPPFDSTCLLWPIKPSGSTIIGGNIPPYRLVLSMNFKIMCVVIQGDYRLKKCERTTIRGEALSHDHNDYQCGSTIFLHSELVTAAKDACKKKNFYWDSFPRSYKGLEFSVPGPYLIYPMIKGKKFVKCPGSNYMVMNYDCVIAGALNMNRKTQELSKCMAISLSEKPESNETNN